MIESSLLFLCERVSICMMKNNSFSCVRCELRYAARSNGWSYSVSCVKELVTGFNNGIRVIGFRLSSFRFRALRNGSISFDFLSHRFGKATSSSTSFYYISYQIKDPRSDRSPIASQKLTLKLLLVITIFVRLRFE
jgi:hypothetical protein